MTERVKVVVIGGGIVGCSVLYGLAKSGWTDAVLLERRNLTSGSTWHAAGNVTYFGHYQSITRLYVNSIRNYLEAEQESGQSVGFHAAGSLRLATDQQQLDGYRKLQASYDKLEIPYKVVLPEEIESIHPLLNTGGIYGAAYTPTDGHVDASGATHALARAAKARGAQIRLRTPVSSLNRLGNGDWQIDTEEDTLIAENVVVATSFWAREMCQSLGLNLPLFALEHHEVITDEVAELKQLDFEVPTVRDPYAPSNTRQEANGFLCGVYESSPVPWATDGIPDDFVEELLVPNPDRLESHLMRVIERIPAFGQAGIKTINNGPISYTPDGCPLLGPVESMPGLWLATGFCVGIGTGGGSGEFLAQWMTTGKPPYDLPIVYPSRFPNTLSKEAAIRQIVATYARGYSNSA